MENRYETFTMLINHISRNIHRIKTREMSEFGLRGTHVSCLYHLYLSDGLTASVLSEKCAEDKGAISRAVDQLEEEGYINRQNTSPKRYNTPLTLTEKGKDTGRRIAEKIDHVLDEIGEGMTAAQRKEMYHQLSTVNETLERIANRSKREEP